MIKSQLLGRLTADSTRDEINDFLSDNSFPLVEGSVVTFVFVGQAEQVALRHWIYGLPSSMPLTRLGDTDVWYRAMEFPTTSRIEYKFGVVRNGHEDRVFDPLNSNVAYDPFGGNSVVHSSDYVDPEWSYEIPDVPQGRFEELTIDSSAFGDKRTLRVYIPPKFRDYRRYRLMVVHDGDDYVKYSRLHHVMDNLINRLEIPPMILALSNPKDRIREYANDPRHARHVVEEIIPAMEAKYPLISDAGGRCITGASFGGVASLSTA